MFSYRITVHIFLISTISLIAQSTEKKAEAFTMPMSSLLTPSQVVPMSSIQKIQKKRSRRTRTSRKDAKYSANESSKLKAVNGDEINESNKGTSNQNEQETSKSSTRIKTKRPARKKNQKKKTETLPKNKSNEIIQEGDQKPNSKSIKPKMVGNAPDIYWRAIPMQHLRLHPLFDPLPPTSEIFYLKSLTEVSQFRQDSWQWQALHMGRCTTSQAASAMGLLEPHAARCMAVPRSLWKPGTHAYDRLKEGGREGANGESTVLVDLEELNEVLFGMEEKEDENWGMDGIKFNDDDDEDNNNNDDGGDSVLYDAASANSNKIWYSYAFHKSYTNANFAAGYFPKYNSPTNEEEVEAIKQRFQHTAMQVRMYWGNTQEATSILTALNYFYEKDSKTRVREIGLCIGNDYLSPHQLSLLKGLQIGASPDSVLVHSDGRLEALEVKNHCPFVENFPRGKNRKNKEKKSSTSSKPTFRINQSEPYASVPSMYVPQLMMEMLCLGPKCRSAVMVRQTATKGAVILRLHRDDEWINNMLELLGRFQTEFMQTNTPPPENFFWEDENVERRTKYQEFVARTRTIGEEAELLDFVEHKKIQRQMPPRGTRHIPLFLD